MGGRNSISHQEIINMKITAHNQYKTLKEYNLEELTISGNTSDESEVCVTALKSEDIADVYTSDNVYLTKFKKLIEAISCFLQPITANQYIVFLVSRTQSSRTHMVPKRRICIEFILNILEAIISSHIIIINQYSYELLNLTLC
jgi:hypothetical protein